MKNGPAQRGSFLQRWLSRSSNASTGASYGGSEVESSATDSDTFSPPPLTDSSSTADSSSAICTPRTSTVYSSRKPPHSSRHVALRAKTPRTPPTRYAELPPVQTCRKLAVSLPPNAQRPSALVVAHQVAKLHPLLGYFPMQRPLIYDITSPPSYIRQPPPPISSSAVVSRRQLIPSSRPVTATPISEHLLSQFATTPPVSRMRIICDLIPWSIHVRGPNTLPSEPKSYVRVLDVLDTINRFLRMGVSQDEWEHIKPKPYRDRVKKAYLERCKKAREYTLAGYEEKQGVRRVDCLLERTMFAGLTIKTPDGEDDEWSERASNGETTWIMIVEPR